MAKGDSLADQLFNRDTVGQLAGHFDDVGVFSNDPFVTDVMNGLHDLELKARISHIADVLARHLPRDFGNASVAIYKALPPPLDPNLQDDSFGHVISAPLGVFVKIMGLKVILHAVSTCERRSLSGSRWNPQFGHSSTNTPWKPCSACGLGRPMKTTM